MQHTLDECARKTNYWKFEGWVLDNLTPEIVASPKLATIAVSADVPTRHCTDHSQIGPAPGNQVKTLKHNDQAAECYSRSCADHFIARVRHEATGETKRGSTGEGKDEYILDDRLGIKCHWQCIISKCFYLFLIFTNFPAI